MSFEQKNINIKLIIKQIILFLFFVIKHVYIFVMITLFFGVIIFNNHNYLKLLKEKEKIALGKEIESKYFALNVYRDFYEYLVSKKIICKDYFYSFLFDKKEFDFCQKIFSLDKDIAKFYQKNITIEKNGTKTWLIDEFMKNNKDNDENSVLEKAREIIDFLENKIREFKSLETFLRMKYDSLIKKIKEQKKELQSKRFKIKNYDYYYDLVYQYKNEVFHHDNYHDFASENVKNMLKDISFFEFIKNNGYFFVANKKDPRKVESKIMAWLSKQNVINSTTTFDGENFFSLMAFNETTNFFFNETNYQYLKPEFDNLKEKNDQNFRDFLANQEKINLAAHYYQSYILFKLKIKILRKINHSFDDNIPLNSYYFKRYKKNLNIISLQTIVDTFNFGELLKYFEYLNNLIKWSNNLLNNLSTYKF